jgi:hypothetical protein
MYPVFVREGKRREWGARDGEKREREGEREREEGGRERD